MRQKLGQHFLTDPEVSDKIAAALDIKAGDTIIEIGPGHGELTRAITAKAGELGEGQRGDGGSDGKSGSESGDSDLRLIAIEKDPELAQAMRQMFEKESGGAGAGTNAKGIGIAVDIIEGDALKELEAAVSKIKNGYKIAGNIPYYITGHLLRQIGELQHLPDLTVLMIQKEVAERLTAMPPRMNRLAAAVQFWAEAEVICAVPRGSFDPPPEVDSAVIALRDKNSGVASNKTSKGAAERYYELVRVLFQQPRKTIANNLSKNPAALAALSALNIDPSGRPQDLSVEQIKNLAQSLP